jgi:tRNA(fMet)-specific endonuclease VapC
MRIFDTDVFGEILLGTARFIDRATSIPASQQRVSVVTIEEILRGRLHAVRRAEAGKGAIAIVRAYELLGQSLREFQRRIILPYTEGADILFQTWRKQKVRVSTHDLRIAAISVDHSATLVSRNRRDFEQVPGLSVEFWD